MAKPKEPTGKKARSLSEDQLKAEPARHLRQQSRTVLQEFWASIERRLKADDPKAADLVARMYAYDKAPGGVNIYNQTLNQVNGAASVAPGSQKIRSFDQIISRFDEVDAGRLIAAPDEDDPVLQPEIIDVEPIVDENEDLAEIEALAGGVPSSPGK